MRKTTEGLRACPDWAGAVNCLSNEEAGCLFKAVLNFEKGREPRLTGGAAVLFTLYRPALETEREKQERFRERQRTNGKKGGRPRRKADGEPGPSGSLCAPANEGPEPFAGAFGAAEEAPDLWAGLFGPVEKHTDLSGLICGPADEGPEPLAEPGGPGGDNPGLFAEPCGAADEGPELFAEPGGKEEEPGLFAGRCDMTQSNPSLSLGYCEKTQNNPSLFVGSRGFSQKPGPFQKNPACARAVYLSNINYLSIPNELTLLTLSSPPTPSVPEVTVEEEGVWGEEDKTGEDTSPCSTAPAGAAGDCRLGKTDGWIGEDREDRTGGIADNTPEEEQTGYADGNETDGLTGGPEPDGEDRADGCTRAEEEQTGKADRCGTGEDTSPCPTAPAGAAGDCRLEKTDGSDGEDREDRTDDLPDGSKPTGTDRADSTPEEERTGTADGNGADGLTGGPEPVGADRADGCACAAEEDRPGSPEADTAKASARGNRTFSALSSRRDTTPDPETAELLKAGDAAGVRRTAMNRERLWRMCEVYSREEVLLALRLTAERADVPCLRYAEGILRNRRAEREAGEAVRAPAAPRRPLPAQDYDQRAYTSEEMDELQKKLIRIALEEDD